MIKTQRIEYQGPDSDVTLPSVWATLEQEYVASETEETSLTDLAQMLAAVRSGKSAHSYVYKNCPWVTITEGSVTVELDFYVWVSDLELNYTLTPLFGEVSAAEKIELHRSFDVAFDNTNAADLGCLFEGEFTPQMPFLSALGEQLTEPEITVDGAVATLSESMRTVFRAEGIAHGFKHRLTMTIVKAVAPDAAELEAPLTNGAIDLFAAADEEPGQEPEALELSEVYSITNLANTITLSWTDENGDSQALVESVTLPQCVEDLLQVCDNDILQGVVGCQGANCNAGLVPVVYYNTCNGEVIEMRWEEGN